MCRAPQRVAGMPGPERSGSPGDMRSASPIRQATRRMSVLSKSISGLADEALVRKKIGPPKPWWIIDPRDYPRRFGIWDGVLTLSLAFVAIVTPFETAFLELDPNAWLNALFIINRLIDLIFILDACLQFVLMKQVSTMDGLRWVSDPKRLCLVYLKGWFIIDLLSVSVSSLDFIIIFGAAGSVSSSLGSSLAGGDSTGAVDVESFSDLRALRVLRALRLIKLVKILTAFRVFRRWEIKVAINYAALSLAKCMVGMLVLAHWFACVWALQASFQASRLDTWMGKDQVYCMVTDAAAGGEQCINAFRLYIAAVYWAATTITSVGYGDITPTPGNTAEQSVALALLIMGSIAWGLVLAVIVANLANIDPEGDEFTQTMGELNKMMIRQNLPQAMRVRLREYFHQSRHVRVYGKHVELLTLMSPSLQSEVSFEFARDWLSRVWFLEKVSDEFLVKLSLQLIPMVLAPGEVAPPGRVRTAASRHCATRAQPRTFARPPTRFRPVPHHMHLPPPPTHPHDPHHPKQYPVDVRTAVHHQGGAGALRRARAGQGACLRRRHDPHLDAFAEQLRGAGDELPGGFDHRAPAARGDGERLPRRRRDASQGVHPAGCTAGLPL